MTITRKQIDELIELKEAEEGGLDLSGDERISLNRLEHWLAVPLAQLVKAAGKDLALLLYAMRVRSDNITPEWRQRIEAVESLAALVRLGGAE